MKEEKFVNQPNATIDYDLILLPQKNVFKEITKPQLKSKLGENVMFITKVDGQHKIVSRSKVSV